MYIIVRMIQDAVQNYIVIFHYKLKMRNLSETRHRCKISTTKYQTDCKVVPVYKDHAMREWR